MNRYEFIKIQIGSRYIDLIENAFKCNYLEAKEKYTLKERFNKVYDLIKYQYYNENDAEIKAALFALDAELEVYTVDGDTIVGNYKDYLREAEKDAQWIIIHKGRINKCTIISNNGRSQEIRW